MAEKKPTAHLNFEAILFVVRGYFYEPTFSIFDFIGGMARNFSVDTWSSDILKSII